MLALLGAAATLAAIQAPASSGCYQTLCNSEAIAPFLARLRAARPNAGTPVHIIQIGDSHTAGDSITQGWRGRLQARHGYGGRGVLAGGRPYQGYLTWGVTASQSAGWRVNATFGARYQASGQPLGMSGFTQTASAPGQTLGIAADSPEQNFDRVVLCAIAQPGGGTFILRMGGEEHRWSLDAPRVQPACRAVDSQFPVGSASVTTEDEGVVSITSFGTFKKRGGVVLSNLGVVGSQLTHLGRTDDAVLRAEFTAYRPDLIVLAYGTNEGFSPAGSGDGFEASIRSQVARIRRLAGANVPILLIGAPDAGTRNAGLSGGVNCGDGWYEPRLLSVVRDRQARVARELRLGFWNWAAAMGGRCSSYQWTATAQMRGDHVHFSRSGGDRIGSLLDADIARAAQNVRAAPSSARDDDDDARETERRRP
ncbi:MAG TPA: SGNH/GDSL hydrolase family protein [Allosphingosinicella sp.]|nr:SGNH/GDSL hydrolase family protein [Allosphingosinicella sp.]